MITTSRRLPRTLLNSVLAGTAIFTAAAATAGAAEQSDVVIYTASPGGIMAAVAAARDGARVLVVEPTKYVGGIVAQGGLVLTDLGSESTIGGLAREFFERVVAHYEQSYGPESQQREHTKFQSYPGGCYEPRVAEKVYEEYLASQPNIRVLRQVELEDVRVQDGRIVSFTGVKPDGERVVVEGKIFLDASYTGDLLAKSGVPYQIGREAQSATGEPLARQTADKAIQAYNYRLTLTKDPENRVPIEQPENYDAENYAYMLDGILRNTPHRIGNIFRPYWRLPNQKQDTNVADMAGENHDYPDATPEQRREIEKRHRDYSLGYIYFLQNDERVPSEIREGARAWGLPRDEFADNGHFPRAIYVREARRMKGEYLMRQQDLQEERRKDDGIALGSYAIDSHSVKTYEDGKGQRRRDGYLFVPVKPYAIPYRAMLPKRENASNLLVPVKMSSTHIAWASMRMEPVFMMTGEAAGAAAAQALKTGQTLHDLDTNALRSRLAEAGALLDPPLDPVARFRFSPAEPEPGEPVKFEFVRLDGAAEPASYSWDFDGDGRTDSTESSPTHAFDQAKATLVSLVVADSAGKNSLPVAERLLVRGRTDGDLQLDSEDAGVSAPNTEQSINQQPYWGTMFRHDSDVRKGSANVAYPFEITTPGTYMVFITTTKPGGRSSKTPVTVEHAGGKDTVVVNQNALDNPFGMVRVGEFRFEPGKPSIVTIGNAGSDSYVIYDVVRLVKKP
jgi:hypothetical protein